MKKIFRELFAPNCFSARLQLRDARISSTKCKKNQRLQMATTATDARLLRETKTLLNSSWTDQQKGRELLHLCLSQAGPTVIAMSQDIAAHQSLRLGEATRVAVSTLCAEVATEPNSITLVSQAILLNKFKKSGPIGTEKTPVYHDDDSLRVAFRSLKAGMQPLGAILDKA